MSWLFPFGIPEWWLWPSVLFFPFGFIFLIEGDTAGLRILGMAFISVAVFSIWVLKPVSEEEEVSNIEEIRCPKCQHRLRIPRNHTGLAGCPACMMKILLKDGEISD